MSTSEPVTSLPHVDQPQDARTRPLWDALAGVADPEIPAVSVVDMGMIRSVDLAGDGRARIVVLPTFTGCPAIDVIKSDVTAAVARVEGVRDVEVTTSFDPPWTTDRITPAGRKKLNDFGLAPPTGTGPVLVTSIGLPTVAICPFCGGRDTRNENTFGPTPCRALYYCNSCRNPFEQFKPV
ncbi:MAG: phenylacetate-CoA oxygenase subunit PaaJ [Actinomycetota bacterium]|nr:phenylacetate-CoA oxygenase subunit PaaJ [Actinomycetota bacterium]